MEKSLAEYIRSRPQAFIRIIDNTPGILSKRIFGIPGSHGASRRLIFAMILKESAIICSLVALLGICVSEIIRTSIFAKIPTLQALMSFDGSSNHGVGIDKGNYGCDICGI
jgi:hypothetical protein